MSQQWWQAECQPVDHVARNKAARRQDQLTKPAGALGELEWLAVELAGLQGRECPRVHAPWISVFAADHGVCEEGVSAYPQAVTRQMLSNFVAGGAAVSVLARALSASLEVVDLGTVDGSPPLEGVRRQFIAAGTANFARGAAMDAQQCQRALHAGCESVGRASASRAGLFIGGEMGIGNTSAATALACVLLDLPSLTLVGPGTGLDAVGVSRKQRVLERALLLHRMDCHSAFDALCRVGGFEIAALTGAFIACAQSGLPVLVDGFIATAAALCAVRLNPGCRPWLLFTHRSAEPGHARLLEVLEARPLLDLGMRLGEGSGAAMAVPLLDLACRLHAGMATFDEAQVSDRD